MALHGNHSRLPRHPKTRTILSDKPQPTGKYIAWLIDYPYIHNGGKFFDGFTVDLVKLYRHLVASVKLPVRVYYFNGLNLGKDTSNLEDGNLHNLHQEGFNIKLLPYASKEQAHLIVMNEISQTMRDLDGDPDLKAMLLTTGNAGFYPTIGRMETPVTILAFEDSVSSLFGDMNIPCLSLDELRPQIEKSSGRSKESPILGYNGNGRR